jgi:hypothetical protein
VTQALNEIRELAILCALLFLISGASIGAAVFVAMNIGL